MTDSGHILCIYKNASKIRSATILYAVPFPYVNFLAMDPVNKIIKSGQYFHIQSISVVTNLSNTIWKTHKRNTHIYTKFIVTKNLSPHNTP